MPDTWTTSIPGVASSARTAWRSFSSRSPRFEPSPMNERMSPQVVEPEVVARTAHFDGDLFDVFGQGGRGLGDAHPHVEHARVRQQGARDAIGQRLEELIRLAGDDLRDDADGLFVIEGRR